MTSSTAARYSIKYAKGKAHIAGLDEVVNTGANPLTYAKSACAALSKSTRWCTARPTDELILALEALRSRYYGTGACMKCERAALAQLAREVGCPNPWHASAPARMHQRCAECPPAT